MKKKGLKKMHLNRETLRHLENENLSGVVGGITTSADPTACNPFSGCASCDGTCGTTCACETRRTCPP
jgi:hypothetical protein